MGLKEAPQNESLLDGIGEQFRMTWMQARPLSSFLYRVLWWGIHPCRNGLGPSLLPLIYGKGTPDLWKIDSTETD